MWRPWGYNKEWRGNAQPLHTDGKDAFTGIPNGIPDGYTQGFINLVRTSPEAGGNALNQYLVNLVKRRIALPTRGGLTGDSVSVTSS